MRQEVKDLAQEYEYANGSYGFIEGVKHQEKENDDFAIAFTDWVIDYSFNQRNGYDLKELLKQFKKEIYETTI